MTSGEGTCTILDDTDWLQIKKLTSHYAGHKLRNFSEAEAKFIPGRKKKVHRCGIRHEIDQKINFLQSIFSLIMV